MNIANIKTSGSVMIWLLFCSTIENYEKISTSDEKFDGMAVLQSLGNFLGVFLGAFTLGSAMGCATALVSFLATHAKTNFRKKTYQNKWN